MPRFHVSLSDIFDEIGDAELLKEANRRKLEVIKDEPGFTEQVRDAYWALCAGRTADAEVILQRVLYPKWKSRAACEDAYQHRCS